MARICIVLAIALSLPWRMAVSGKWRFQSFILVHATPACNVDEFHWCTASRCCTVVAFRHQFKCKQFIFALSNLSTSAKVVRPQAYLLVQLFASGQHSWVVLVVSLGLLSASVAVPIVCPSQQARSLCIVWTSLSCINVHWGPSKALIGYVVVRFTNDQLLVLLCMLMVLAEGLTMILRTITKVKPWWRYHDSQ